MAVLWRDSMSVSNNEVDRDHKYLISLINTMELVLQEPEDKAPIISTLEQLKKYTIEHFQREELLQIKVRYPKMNEHKQIHKSLVIQLDKIIASVKSETSAALAGERSSEILELLRNWLIEHVLQEDLQIKPYFAKFPPTLT